jgi:hypothetical protein
MAHWSAFISIGRSERKSPYSVDTLKERQRRGMKSIDVVNAVADTPMSSYIWDKHISLAWPSLFNLLLLLGIWLAHFLACAITNF